MNKKILVPLGRYDRSEEMIPYIENVARPGMKVVFLMRYRWMGFGSIKKNMVSGPRWRQRSW